jgi:lipopolysaccharide/colanic/teichoic acid biosynthesis glycosyltransferase
MDLRYLRECSLGFDLLILLRTVRVVLTCEGAQ